MTLDLISAFIIGLLGSGHCIVMCGGITTMLTTALSPQLTHQSKRYLIINYHIGRISSYTLIGTIVGFTGSMAAKNIGLPLYFFNILAGVFLIFLGLYLGQWLMWLSHIEKIGQHLWRKISPLSKNLLPIKNKKQALGLGVLWGWLPCGLIYSTLTWSLASTDALQGGLIMFAFGLGTLPALISVSLGITQFQKLLSLVWLKKVTALLLIAYGCYQLSIA